MTISLSSGNNPRLVCEAYFAITSNTVQFGARAALYASAAGFSVEGEVGFDVLVQLMPLHFIADFQARLQLKRGSHNLFMVGLKGSLEGPRPLRVSGKATFEILWFDLSVRFDTTLVKGERPPLPPAINVLAQLSQALTSPTSWSTERSATQTHGVALRSLPAAGPGAPVVLDPLGQVRVVESLADHYRADHALQVRIIGIAQESGQNVTDIQRRAAANVRRCRCWLFGRVDIKRSEPAFRFAVCLLIWRTPPASDPGFSRSASSAAAVVASAGLLPPLP